jgi:hypothetical protein
MRCAEFERRFQLALDERRSPRGDASLEAHARQCGDCWELLVGQERLAELLERGVPPLSRDFAQRSTHLVPVPRPVASRGIPWTMMLSAAAVFVVCFLVPLSRREASRDMGASTLSPSPPPPARSHRPLGARGTIAAWSQRPGGSAARHAQTPFGPTTPADRDIRREGNAPNASGIADSDELRRTLVELWTRIPEMPPERLEPIDRIAGGIRPLASTLAAALDAIRRTLPVARESRPREPQALITSSSGAWKTA